MSTDAKNSQEEQTQVSNEQIETAVQEAVQETTQASESAESPQEMNWKRFREEREKERRLREEAEQKRKEQEEQIKLLKEALSSQSQPQRQHISHNPFDDLYEEEEKKIESAVEKKLREYQEKLDQERKQKELQELPYRIRSEHPDFDQVCTTENMDYLDFHHPEIAKMIANQPEGHEKYSTLYKTVKKLVPLSKEKNNMKLQQNMAKPRAPETLSQGSSSSPTAGFLTEQQRADNWKRMQRIMKGIE